MEEYDASSSTRLKGFGCELTVRSKFELSLAKNWPKERKNDRISLGEVKVEGLESQRLEQEGNGGGSRREKRDDVERGEVPFGAAVIPEHPEAAIIFRQSSLDSDHS